MPHPLTEIIIAADWGDGFCLFCGELVHTVEGPNAEECPQCETLTVIPAKTILRFMRGDDEEDEKS